MNNMSYSVIYEYPSIFIEILLKKNHMKYL